MNNVKETTRRLERKSRDKMISDYKELRIYLMDSLSKFSRTKITDLEVCTSGKKDIVIISTGRNHYSFSYNGKDISVEQVNFNGDYEKLLNVITAVRYHKKKINDIMYLYKMVMKYRWTKYL